MRDPTQAEIDRWMDDEVTAHVLKRSGDRFLKKVQGLDLATDEGRAQCLEATRQHQAARQLLTRARS